MPHDGSKRRQREPRDDVGHVLVAQRDPGLVGHGPAGRRVGNAPRVQPHRLAADRGCHLIQIPGINGDGMMMLFGKVVVVES